MAYKIKWSPRAASNFEYICSYIARDSEYYAAFLQRRSMPLLKVFLNFLKQGELFLNMEMKTYGKGFTGTIESFIVLKKKWLKLLQEVDERWEEKLVYI